MREKDIQIRRLKLRVEEFERAAGALSPNESCDVLDIPDLHPEDDFHFLFKRLGSDIEELELALGVNTGETFRQWQADDESPPLSIEGGLTVSSR